jgi:hypothetical protein
MQWLVARRRKLQAALVDRHQRAYSVGTQFTVPTGKRGKHPSGMTLVTRMAALQAEQRREVQWNHRV